MFDMRRPEQPDFAVFTHEMELPFPDSLIDNGFGPEDPDEYDEDEESKLQVWYRDNDRYSAKPYNRSSFIFHPSFLDAYWDLKKIDPRYAEIYIECLMGFGVDRFDEVPDVPVIKMALRAPFITIDKAFTNYVLRRHEERRQEKRELEARQTAKQIKEAINLMETKQVEWEKRIKKEWPYFYGK